MISAKEIRFLAERKWDSGRLWCDNNKNIIRCIYRNSDRQDRKINLQFFCEHVGLELGLAWRIGQLDRFRDDMKRRKYGQKLRRETIDTRGIEKDFDVITAGTGRKTKGGGTVSIQTGQFFGA